MSRSKRTSDHRLIVFTEPVPGREDEYNEWYDAVHMSEVLELDGFVSAQRFKLAEAQMDATGDTVPARYLAIYEIDGENIAAILDSLTAGASKMNISEALDMNAAQAFAFTAIGEKVSAA